MLNWLLLGLKYPHNLFISDSLWAETVFSKPLWITQSECSINACQLELAVNNHPPWRPPALCDASIFVPIYISLLTAHLRTFGWKASESSEGGDNYMETRASNFLCMLGTWNSKKIDGNLESVWYSFAQIETTHLIAKAEERKGGGGGRTLSENFVAASQESK